VLAREQPPNLCIAGSVHDICVYNVWKTCTSKAAGESVRVRAYVCLSDGCIVCLQVCVTIETLSSAATAAKKTNGEPTNARSSSGGEGERCVCGRILRVYDVCGRMMQAPRHAAICTCMPSICTCMPSICTCITAVCTYMPDMYAYTRACLPAICVVSQTATHPSSTTAADYLAGALFDSQHQVRLIAARALGKIYLPSHTRATKRVLRALESADPEVFSVVLYVV